MNELEQQLDYPHGDTLPALGSTLEVAPGVRWLRMVLPFQLDHINLWLLRDEQDGVQGWSIVDCGISNDQTRAAWEQIFANELQGLPVLRVIVTHMHPDHIGLAHWLTERWGGEDVGQRHRLQHRTPVEQLDHRLRWRSHSAVHGQPWPHRPRFTSADQGPHQLLREHGAEGAGKLSAADGR
ncbi:MAG: MBL fold metallo-hydrolase [Burkholderiaceae bacterium]